MNDRYCRQIPLLGKKAQSNLENNSILIIGAGGVGSPLSLYLAGSGIGTLGIIDFDNVDLTNLHRQILFSEEDIGKNKARQGAQKLKTLNSEINIKPYAEKLTIKNAKQIFQEYELIIDGSDNFQTRYLANDICCQLNLPLISASIYKSQIQIATINPKVACYRCIFPEPPPPNIIQTCSLSGIIGSTSGIAGSVAASIAIQIISNSTALDSKILRINCDNYSSEQLEFRKNPTCRSCKDKLVTWPAVNYRIRLDDIELNDYMVIDIRELYEDRSEILVLNQLHSPFSELINNLPQLPNKKILIYCSQGVRSEYAAHLLRSRGFEAFSLGLSVDGKFN
ncbi:HesA/MoeB/ThiF family protein [Legionella sp. 16cNR16C]|uniref:HesA/MoeB/ThiF family protein n=1 Tax=Legionella sp. 16cNR16C TaxID=2905656 RepID=UPI001E4A43B3|nr:HesA/MoeB/ThiF family protein [Legionella sp. 16cNR16C]MCE3045431.1 HesA/MoeB/ThiF family protein [Legionella sp. 16cNR16C]